MWLDEQSPTGSISMSRVRAEFVTTGLAVAIVLLSLAACGNDSGPTLAERVRRAESLAPSDPQLAEKFGRSCRVCHINPESGAPLVGDIHAWNGRFAQGGDTLLAHVRAGFKAMPGHGQCFDCTDDDLRRLTFFMAQREAR